MGEWVGWMVGWLVGWMVGYWDLTSPGRDDSSTSMTSCKLSKKSTGSVNTHTALNLRVEPGFKCGLLRLLFFYSHGMKNVWFRTAFIIEYVDLVSRRLGGCWTLFEWVCVACGVWCWTLFETPHSTSPWSRRDKHSPV